MSDALGFDLFCQKVTASYRPRKHRWAGNGQTARLNPAPAEALMLKLLVASTEIHYGMKALEGGQTSKKGLMLSLANNRMLGVACTNTYF